MEIIQIANDASHFRKNEVVALRRIFKKHGYTSFNVDAVYMDLKGTKGEEIINVKIRPSVDLVWNGNNRESPNKGQFNNILVSSDFFIIRCYERGVIYRFYFADRLTDGRLVNTANGVAHTYDRGFLASFSNVIAQTVNESKKTFKPLT